MSNARNLSKLLGTDTQITTPDIADGVFQANKNLIINGAMQVNQRQTTFTGANGTSGYIVDRFSWATSNTGSFDVSSSTTSPVGFSNSIGISCTTAEASPTAGSYQNVIYRLEAQSIQQLNASSGTVAFTISFYVYSSKTGTYTIEARKMDSARHIAQEFTISSANTWERKTISIPADVTGSIDNDNGSGIQLYFWLAGGTTYTSGTLATSWGAFDNANRVSSNNVNIGDSTSNTFYITGVQLEVGEQATPFEHRSFGDELAKCQRYYQHWEGNNSVQFWGYKLGSTSCNIIVPYMCQMRTLPSLVSDFSSSGLQVLDMNIAWRDLSDLVLSYNGNQGCRIVATTSATMSNSNGTPAELRIKTGGYVGLDAEL